MAFDWLFGPRIVHHGVGRYEIRSLVLNQDTVRDVLALVKSGTGDAGLYTVDKVAAVDSTPVRFDDNKLSAAADWDLRRLMVRGGADHMYFAVDLRNGEQPNIFYSQMEHEELARQVADLMLSEGSPRPRWKHIVPRLPLLAAVVGAVSWIWFVLSRRPDVSLGLTGSMLVTLSVFTAWNGREQLERRIRLYIPGHRIRAMSRLEIRTRRADRHANLRLSAITLPAGALIGAAAAWLVG